MLMVSTLLLRLGLFGNSYFKQNGRGISFLRRNFQKKYKWGQLTHLEINCFTLINFTFFHRVLVHHLDIVVTVAAVAEASITLIPLGHQNMAVLLHFLDALSLTHGRWIWMQIPVNKSKKQHFTEYFCDVLLHNIIWLLCRHIYTGRERLIRSHSSARFSFELSGNSN